MALIRLLCQSNERRHRLRSYGQAQTTFYSQIGSSFYNSNPIQNQLPIDLISSINSHKELKDTKQNEDEKMNSNFKSLPNSPNSSNSNFLEQNLKKPKKSTDSSNKLSASNQAPLKMNLNESVSSNNLNNNNLSALSPSRSHLKLDITKRDSKDAKQSSESLLSNKIRSLKKDHQQTDQSNQSLNQPFNLTSRNNSSASCIYPSFLNSSASFNNRPCRLNNNTTCDRTTKMLLAILFLFLITELPSGIINLLVAILGKVYFEFFFKISINPNLNKLGTE